MASFHPVNDYSNQKEFLVKLATLIVSVCLSYSTNGFSKAEPHPSGYGNNKNASENTSSHGNGNASGNSFSIGNINLCFFCVQNNSGSKKTESIKQAEE